MKTYRSHKVVQAAKIIGVETSGQTVVGLALEDGTQISPEPKLTSRHRPIVGDYLVKYDDGYLSLSPAKAFEEGYREIPESNALTVTIEATSRLVALEAANGAEIPGRVWQGRTLNGIPVVCVVTRIAVPDGRPESDYAAFEQQLQRKAEPTVMAVKAFDLRTIL